MRVRFSGRRVDQNNLLTPYVVMQTEMLTPSRISRPVATHPVITPAYNWSKQSRYDETIKMGLTSSTKQTFNTKGQPCDRTSDQD
jgi:hypothetical protein